MTCIVFTVSRPPSSNKLWIGEGKNKRRTRRYKGWINDAGWMLNTHRLTPIEGPVVFRVFMPRPINNDGEWSRGKIDCSNFIKGLEDLSVIHGLIEDDSHWCVYKSSSEWDDTGTIEQGKCRVVITPIGDVA